MKTKPFVSDKKKICCFSFPLSQSFGEAFLIYFAASFELRARALQSDAFARDTPKEDQARFLSLSVTASTSLGLEAGSKIYLGLSEKLILG